MLGAWARFGKLLLGSTNLKDITPHPNAKYEESICMIVERPSDENVQGVGVMKGGTMTIVSDGSYIS